MSLRILPGTAPWLVVGRIALPWGTFHAAATREGELACLSFPQADDGEALVRLLAEAQHNHPGTRIEINDRLIGKFEFIDELKAYLDGNLLQFSTTVLPGRFGEFSWKVWNAASEIPFGETRSYGQLAEACGCRAPRAVGTALGRNPVPILIPCHRIVQANGKLGGFSGGLDWKAKLLQLEAKSAVPALPTL